MENLKQLKNEVDDIMDKLVNLSSELDNVEEEKEEFDFNNINLIGKKYAFNGHPLSNYDDYTKQLYFTFLSAMMQYESNITESKLLFLCRLNEGCDTNLKLKDIIKLGVRIKDKLYEEFIYVIKNSNLQHNFIVDALILIGISNERSSIEFLSELTEVLELQKEELDFLTKLSMNILEQNNQKYGEVIKEIPSSIDISYFFFYIKEYVEGCIMKSKKMLWYFSKSMSKFRFNIESVTISSENIVFQNFIFDLSNVSLKFLQGNNITFENCEFIGGTKPIEIDSYNTLTIYNCIYKNFNNRTFYIKNIKEITIENSIFDSCSLNNENDVSGGVIYTKECENIRMVNNKFVNCKILHSVNKDSYGIIFYNHKGKVDILLQDSMFIDCNKKCIRLNEDDNFMRKIFNESTTTTLLGKKYNLTDIGCEFTNCAQF